ncbi:nucleotidyltransferase domain-containing protein [Candidatus Sumerlaeota bacterium]|nr:nucleotidyltransferase domain-containing protein [Candidatus Sumerlaeota bacterium]
MKRREIIEEMKRRLVEKFDPQAVILFGSSVRGEPGQNSDIDLLILTPIETNYNDLWFAMYDSLADLEVPKDLVLMTPGQFERDRQYVGTLARPAWREGKVLYERKRS